MSFKDLTPEQRKMAAEKSAATRRAKREAKKIENLAVVSREWGEPEANEVLEEHFPEPELDINDPFDIFVRGLAASTKETLGLDELRAIYNANAAKAEAEKKAVAKKVAAEDALQVARMAAGLIPQSTQAEMETRRRNSELVRWTCELPPSGDQGEIPDEGVRIDGKLFRHGSVHTLSRAQYDSYREIIYRASEHELTFKGQNSRQRKWMLGRALGSVDQHIPLNDDGSLV